LSGAESRTVAVEASTIGSGIAIAPYLPEWGILRGGASVHIIAIAAVTLEIISDGLERAGSVIGVFCRGVRPIP
jgi:hypothetical protein